MTEERLKLFEKAETRINAIIDTLSQDKGGLADKLKQENVKDFLVSLWVDCATENGIQWHDLRKDPNDLPKKNKSYWVYIDYQGNKIYQSIVWQGYWLGWNCIPLAWCEEPIFKE